MVGRPFKKGQSGNPGGRPKLPAEIAKAREAGRNECDRIFFEFLKLNRTELQAKLQDPDATVLELAIGSIMAKAAKDGDQIRLGFILDRLYGKVADKVENTNVNIDFDPKEYEEIPREVILKIAAGSEE